MIEMPMAEVAMNVAAEPIVTWSAYGTLLERDGNRGAPGAPQGVYACAGHEQWVALSITDDDEWRALVRVLGDPEWATRRRRSATGAGRRAASRRASTPRWPSGSTGATATTPSTRCSPPGVLAAPVWDQMIQDELPQLAERGFTQWLEHPIAGPVGYPGTGVRADTVRQLLPRPGADRRPAHRPRSSRRARPHRRRARRPPRSRRHLTRHPHATTPARRRSWVRALHGAVAEGAGGEAAVDVGEAVLVGQVAGGDGAAGSSGRRRDRWRARPRRGP